MYDQQQRTVEAGVEEEYFHDQQQQDLLSILEFKMETVKVFEEALEVLEA